VGKRTRALWQRNGYAETSRSYGFPYARLFAPTSPVQLRPSRSSSRSALPPGQLDVRYYGKSTTI
jgi:hypothetical protein